MKEPSSAQPGTAPIYRLVVNAAQHKAKQFVWVIVDDSRCFPVQTSKQTYPSMEDAYNAGKGALEYWRERMRRTNPSVDLAQPAPAKQRTDRVPIGPLTSRIYSRG